MRAFASAELDVARLAGMLASVNENRDMKVVGRPKERSIPERFDRLQAIVGAVAARPLMRRGTVMRFRSFDEFESWKRQATRAHRASRGSLIS
ncbi:MAG: hypothetical protein ACREIA_04905 [Opitutaceae bacterium]